MHMSYWFGTDVGDFLFEGFTVVTIASFLSTCFGLLSIAVLFEGVKIGLVWSRHNASLIENNIQSEIQHTEASTLLKTTRNRCCSWSREIMSYTLMLAVMTYNGYFTLSIIIGGGIGFFIFSPLLMELGLRNASIRGPILFCRICTGKAKRREGGDGDSLADVAQGVSDVANTADREERESTPTIAVVQIHSATEPQPIV